MNFLFEIPLYAKQPHFWPQNTVSGESQKEELSENRKYIVCNMYDIFLYLQWKTPTFSGLHSSDYTSPITTHPVFSDERSASLTLYFVTAGSIAPSTSAISWADSP